MIEEKRLTLGDLISFGLNIPEEGKMLHIHMGSYGIEYLLSTIVAALNKIKETDPEYAADKFKELSEKLQKGCSPGEGCYRITPINGGNDSV